MAGSDSGAPRVVHDFLNRAKALDAELAGAGFRPPVTGPPPQTEPTDAPAADPMAQFDTLISDPDLSAVARTLYRDGYYARAVEEGYKFLNNAVKGKSGEAVRDGQPLMLHVFDPDAPILRLNRLRTTSQKDEQAGYRFVFAGVMTGVRNPRAHDHALRDEADIALELLVTANHLMRQLRRSTRTRRRRAQRRTP
jgi:uncharacterized protein (TIGR02391 family)